MRIVPIAQVAELTTDEIIPAIRGRVTEIYKAKRGESSAGKWCIQNLKLRDETGEIQVKLKDREELPVSYKGKVIFILSKQGDKGLTGIKAKDDEYPRDSGKFTRIVSVTPTATIEESDTPAQPPARTNGQNGNGNGHSNGHTPAPQNRPAPTQAKTTPPPRRDEPAQEPETAPTPPPTAPNHPPHVPETNHGKVGECKRALNRIANLYLIALEAGSYIRKTYDDAHPDKLMTDEQHQAAVSSIFIQASRDNWHTQLPTGRIE